MELKRQAYIVTSIAFSPDGKYVLSGSWDNTVKLWDISQGKQIRAFKGHTGYVSSAAFSPDGRYALSGSNDQTLKLWDISTGNEIRTFIHTEGGALLPVKSVAFSPSGRYVLSVRGDNLKLWDVSTGKGIKTFMQGERFLGIPNVILSAAFSPDGRYIMSIMEDTLTLWDVETGKEIRRFVGEPSFLEVKTIHSSVSFSPDGKYALSPLRSTLGLWDVATGKEIRAFGSVSYADVITSGAFSPDGRYVLSGGSDYNVRLWEVSTGKEVRTFTGNTWAVSTVAFSRDGKYALSGGFDASIRIWDISTGEEVAMMAGFDDGEWIAITSEGYYNASENGAKDLSVKVDNIHYSVDRFYDVFYRPDIVSAKLHGEDISGLVTITMKDAVKSPPPSVEFTAIPSDTDKSRAKVCYRAKSTGGGIGEVRLFHNGKLIKSDGYYREAAKTGAEKISLAALSSKVIYEDMRGVKVKEKGRETGAAVTKSKGDVFNDCEEIETISGENEVSVTAFNRDNTVQSYMKTAGFNAKIQSEEPHLYILSVGIDRYKDSSVNLKYAVKDAKDIQERFMLEGATLYKPENIHHEMLTDRDATKTDILNKVSKLSKRIKPNDNFIFFAAGHGVLLQNQYFMLTHDYDGALSDNILISANEIVEMSKEIKSLSQLFIFDTCHAGGVDYIVSGLYDARMSVLAKKMGLHIYASASSLQEAMDGYKGNGLFSHSLLDGLNNNSGADKNSDGKVSLVELGEYSKMTTVEISKKIGYTQIPLIINFGKDNAVYNLR